MGVNSVSAVNVAKGTSTSKTMNPSSQGHTLKQKHNDVTSTKVKVASLAGTGAGITLAVSSFLSKAKKAGVANKVSDLRFGPGKIILLGASAVAGGLVGGLAVDDKKNREAKLKEAITQFAGNILVPVSLTGINTKLLEKSGFALPQIKNASSKIAKYTNSVLRGAPTVVVTIASLVGGLKIGNVLTNKANEKIFHSKEKREVKPTDFTAHADDICLASSLVFSGASKLQAVVSKLLPLTFLVAGYEAGTQQKQDS